MLNQAPLDLSDPAKVQAAAVYNAAADHFDDPPLSFWNRYGRGTVERIGLRPGMTVLDVGCGTGASALPAAKAVGPTGRVIGVDIAEHLLSLAHAKAEMRGLRNIDLRMADMAALDFPADHLDAVISVFSIFFGSDMKAQVAELWRVVKPGGVLAITTWGDGFCEPAAGYFWESIADVRPDLVRTFNPWDAITTPKALWRLLDESGVDLKSVEVVTQSGRQTLTCPEDWWTVVLGSGFRGVVDQLSEEDREAVRKQCIGEVRRNDLAEINTNVVYAFARKNVLPTDP